MKTMERVAEPDGRPCRHDGSQMTWSSPVPRTSFVYYMFGVSQTEELDGVPTCSAERVPPGHGR
ncbi:MAG: hypothetical protein COY42_08450 [Armatimonadetes bacterium CG_4_10_14_0_8_um_filter_66_14]|nr:MAG: hypothetical protein COY42_08450 [Armatimonadetes bacterium CG_4_10_14_0_8_um_filter_66_14]